MHNSRKSLGDFSGGPGLTLHALNAGGPGSIPGQRTRAYMPQLRVHREPSVLRTQQLRLRAAK